MNITPLFSQPHHPVVVTPGADASFDALSAYLSENALLIQQLLLEHGGILFRDFQIDGVEKFDACAANMGAIGFSYSGGNSPRTQVSGDVFTSTEYPATEAISLHNEMSYLPAWPTRLFFYSAIPAATGGQTSLANSGDVLKAMPDGLVTALRNKRIRYVRKFHANLKVGKTWQSTYMTDDRQQVEAILKEQNSTCEWKHDGALHVSTTCDAVTRHPVTGQEVWFNQAEQWHPSALNPQLRAVFEPLGLLSHHAEFGDGEQFDDAALHEVRRIMNQNKLLFTWRKNDLLVVDNVLMMHGRESFTGARKTLAYLSRT